MTIRRRLTLWYAGILFVFTLVIAILCYYEFFIESKPDHNPAPESDEGFGEAVEMFLWCGLPAALIAMGGGWFLMTRALAPISALTQAAVKIDGQNLGKRLTRSGNGDELDRLTEVFNSMIARLDHSFQQIREFTLHASHELKTPLTIMRGEMETVLRETSLTAEQRERLLSHIDEIQRLAKIVDGLSLLTKADAGQLLLNQEDLRLDEIVQDAFEDAQILAQHLSIRVSLQACEKITVRGDRHRLRQLLLNLTDNAIKYNKPGGTVNIQLRSLQSPGAPSAAHLSVSNTGPGIPAELQSRVFEPFFRGDPSHVSTTDGCGLGLSIVRCIVDAHGGTIAVESTVGGVTTFTIRIFTKRVT